MNREELVELAKKATNATETEVAERIGLTKQALNDFKKGRSKMPDTTAMDLARLAGVDEANAVSQILADQAKPRIKEVYEEIARRTAQAAVIALPLSIAGFLPVPGEASSSPAMTPNTVYYVKY